MPGHQLQARGELLDALGEGVAGALEFVLGRLQLGQFGELLGLLGGQRLGAAEVFQGLLRIQHVLVQLLCLGLARGAVGGDALLGLELLQLLLQALLLVAQGGAVGQGLQRRRFDVRQVDAQARGFEMLALEVVEDGFDALHPDVAVIQVHPVLAERQAEQRAVEQTHQAFHVLLAELLAQACVAVVVGVFELLADVLQAFFQVAQALFQVFAGELPRMGQGAGQFVVGILGGEQLLFEDLGVVDQGEAGLEHRQLAEPALDAGDLALQAHQLLVPPRCSFCRPSCSARYCSCWISSSSRRAPA